MELEISAEQQYREWRDRVRGRVGARVRAPWRRVLDDFGDEQLRTMFDQCPDLDAAAAAIIQLINRQFEVSLA